MKDQTQFNLSGRQTQLLTIIIEEYISTALPVGSETLDKKYNLGISPATIRNEMVKLTKMGLLSQPFTSAGRSPTPIALKYYVNNMLKTKTLSVAEEVSVKEKVWDHRHKLDKLLKEATSLVAKRTKALALTATDEGNIYYAGAANLLYQPEFFDLKFTRNIFLQLDEYNFWQHLFFDRVDDFQIYLGDEIGEMFTSCGLVSARFKIAGQGQGVISVLGSNRLDYSYVIPIVRYIGSLISEISS